MYLTPRRVLREDAHISRPILPGGPKVYIWAMELPATAYTADMTRRVAAFWFLSNERALPKLSTSGKA